MFFCHPDTIPKPTLTDTTLGSARFHQFVSGHRFNRVSHDFVRAEMLHRPPRGSLDTELVSIGEVYRVTLVNPKSYYNKRVFQGLRNGPQEWTLLAKGNVFYTFDVGKHGTEVWIDDVELELINDVEPVADPPELKDGMLIEMKWEGFPWMLRTYRKSENENDTIEFVTPVTRTGVTNQLFEPAMDEWRYPEYAILDNIVEIEVLDLGSNVPPTILKPQKGSMVHVCVATLTSGETRVLVADILEDVPFRSYSKLWREIETSETIECEVIKVKKKSFLTKEFGDLPLSTILGVWRKALVTTKHEDPSEIGESQWNCNWVRNDQKFVLDLYTTQIRAKPVVSGVSLPPPPEPEPEELLIGETYFYHGRQWVVVREVAEAESKVDEIVFELEEVNKEKKSEVIFKTTTEVLDSWHPSYLDQFEEEANMSYNITSGNVTHVWKIISTNYDTRQYVLRAPSGEEVVAYESETEPSPVVVSQFQINQLLGYDYEFYRLVATDETLATLSKCDANTLKELEPAELVEGVRENKLNEWCMYKGNICRLKMKDGEPTTVDKKGVLNVQLFSSATARRPSTVEKLHIVFNEDIEAEKQPIKWRGTFLQNQRVSVDTKGGRIQGVIVNHREKDTTKNGGVSQRLGLDEYKIQIDGQSKLSAWISIQKIEKIVDGQVVKELTDVTNEPEDMEEDEEAESGSESATSEEESSDDEDDEYDFDLGQNVLIIRAPASGRIGQEVRHDENPRIFTIARWMTASDFGETKISTEHRDLILVKSNANVDNVAIVHLQNEAKKLNNHLNMEQNEGVKKETQSTLAHLQREIENLYNNDPPFKLSDLFQVIPELDKNNLEDNEVFYVHEQTPGNAQMPGKRYTLKSRWDSQKTLESIPTVCLEYFTSPFQKGQSCFIKDDPKYTHHRIASVVMSQTSPAQKTSYYTLSGLDGQFRHTQIENWEEPPAENKKVLTDGNKKEVFQVVSVDCRTVSLLSLWDSRTLAVDVTEIIEFEDEEYNAKDWVTVLGSDVRDEVKSSKNNRVTLKTEPNKTYSPSELKGSHDPDEDDSEGIVDEDDESDDDE